MAPHKALYSAFDVFPSFKGAARHIAHASQTLFRVGQGGLLCVLGAEGLLPHEVEGPVEVLRFPATMETNYLKRALAFKAWLRNIVEQYQESLSICQFRDPWSGLALIEEKSKAKLIYEVNGLPSLELPELYPGLNQLTIGKIAHVEAMCLQRADVIITPSSVLGGHLACRGVDPAKITVIPNGAVYQDIPAPDGNILANPYIIYFGAVQPWQGVEVLLQAFSLLRDLDLSLVLCLSLDSHRAKNLRKLAERLGLASRVIWKYQLEQEELNHWIRQAIISVAPLRATVRNTIQGSCPLKILESMALGVPVVASDLPSVTELVAHEQDGYLVRPDRPGELSRAIRLMHDYPEVRRRLGQAASEKIKSQFSWELANSRQEAVLRKFVVEKAVE